MAPRGAVLQQLAAGSLDAVLSAGLTDPNPALMERALAAEAAFDERPDVYFAALWLMGFRVSDFQRRSA